MRRLMLLRHAKADWPDGVADHERPLARRGQRQGPEMARFMAAEGLVPDRAIVSTAKRTQETWELVAPAFPPSISKSNDARIYEAPKENILKVIREADDAAQALLLIGHNPGFAEVAYSLINTDQASPALSRLERGYPTSGLAVIDFQVDHWADIAEGSGRLQRFETPASIGD
ncbi:SixA phosphatase family protein [Pollutimonas harenae]|uniref:Histidine phosphatase family protein n=1 Tax=Pollutimonas harenae TaxID=657015 RepID=A0A853H5F4_9BURK|nr:histidine phosphatase family protein [Pollutimonas harenae]NYT86405.1 histidine phosphatase family protein [Pollutimonas harenae]TEA69842.1 histidine phosphatase family protein [Pollutimonas harenae]